MGKHMEHVCSVRDHRECTTGVSCQPSREALAVSTGTRSPGRGLRREPAAAPSALVTDLQRDVARLPVVPRGTGSVLGRKKDRGPSSRVFIRLKTLGTGVRVLDSPAGRSLGTTRPLPLVQRQGAEAGVRASRPLSSRGRHDPLPHPQVPGPRTVVPAPRTARRPRRLPPRVPSDRGLGGRFLAQEDGFILFIFICVNPHPRTFSHWCSERAEGMGEREALM